MNISLYRVHLNVSSSENDNKCSVMQEIGKADYYPVITKGDNIYIVIIVLFCHQNHYLNLNLLSSA